MARPRVASSWFDDNIQSRVLDMIHKKIEEPWRSKLIDLVEALGSSDFIIRFSGLGLFQGKVVSCNENSLVICPHRFIPGVGFEEGPNECWDLHIPRLNDRAVRVSEGISFTFFGGIGSENGTSLSLAEDVCIIPAARWVRTSPMNLFHLFSGSFGGWSQAIECLLKDPLFPPLGQQVCIDSDPVTMGLWSQQVGRPHHLGRTSHLLPWNPASHLGICTPVDDRSLMHQVIFHSNSVGTASPPCVSWSKAGRSKGLNSDAGFAFVEAVIITLALRPSIQVFECADEILNHSHFGLISHLLKLGGFRRVWQQISSLHSLSDTKRDRWLSVWVRADHEHEPNSKVYHLHESLRSPWHSQLYTFALPQEFLRGLVLTEDMKMVYGAHHLLPPAKKARLSPDADRESVLMQRAVALNEPLPTFCAMYGRQHELDSNHVASKGLFASFMVNEGSMHLIEPTRIAALLGGVNRISLPSNPLDAFHGLGNAISIPQASLALLVGLQAINRSCLDIESIVCQVWNKRVTSQNAIVIDEGNFISIVHVSSLVERLSFRPDSCVRAPMKFTFDSVHGPASFVGSCDGDWTVTQLLSSMIQIEPHAASQFSLRHGLVVASAADSIFELTLLSWTWDVCVAAVKVATICFEEGNQEDEIPQLSPTCPFIPVAQIETVLVPSAPYELESAKENFLVLIKFFEDASARGYFGLQEDVIPTVLCCIDPQLVFVTSRSQSADFRMIHDCLHQFGFRHWQFRRLRGRSVRLPHHEWWVLQNPEANKPCVIENLTSIIDYQIVELEGFVTPHTVILRHEQSLIIQRINGVTLDADRSHEVCDGDVFTTVFQDDQLRRVENTQRVFAGGHPEAEKVVWQLRAGANLSERCEFAINTNGWCASDEIKYAMSWLLADHEERCISFALLQWNAIDSDFDETTFSFPNVAPESTTWFAILVDSHWIGCEVSRVSDDVQITFLGVDSLKAHRLGQIFARRLDTTGRKIQTFVHAFPQPFHMCGWALLYRWFEKLGQHDQLKSYEEDLEDFVEWKYSLIHEVLSSSVEDWIAADAPPILWHFARQIRLGCFYHLALNDNDAAPVIDHAIYVELPRGPSLSLPGRVLHYDEYDHFVREFQNQRVDEFHKFPGWLGSDVADCALQLLRTAHPEIAITAPMMWNSIAKTMCTFSGYKEDCRFHRRAISLILFDQHWISCELHRQQDRTIAWVLAPTDFAHDLQCLVDQLQILTGFGEGDFQLIHLPCDTQLGLCGWTPLFELFNKLEVTMPRPGIAITHASPLLWMIRVWQQPSCLGMSFGPHHT